MAKSLEITEINLRVSRSLQDFFMIKDRRIDPEIDEGTSKFFRKVIWILIVLNILIGIPTIYDIYFYEQTPEILRDISTIQTNEV